MKVPVFDGHNDFLLRLLQSPHLRSSLWLGRHADRHIDLARLRSARFAGGFFSMFVPSGDAGTNEDALDVPPYDLPLARPPSAPEAMRAVRSMIGHMEWMERASLGTFRICRSVADLRRSQAEGVVGGVMHLEGAEAIRPGSDDLDRLHGLGLRSLGLVWSRPNAFGHGVPFRFPSDPDIGPGLTEAGIALVRSCNRLRILVDLSHLNSGGFDDVARISDAPLVASHSGAHAVSPSSRNLTDRQLEQIAESKGLVGLNFATILLRRDGRRTPVMGWSPLLRHLEHLIRKVGEDHVGFGSDMEGAVLPACMGDVTGFGELQQVLSLHGYQSDLIEKLFYRNWHGVLERTWGR
jgi:membrane dipeptidase